MRRSRWYASVCTLACSLTLLSASGCSFFFGPANEHLLQDGVRARATVVSITETGSTINNRPVCDIVVRVEPTNGAAYQTTVRKVVALTQIPQLQPGNPVTVRYDPNDPKQVLIEALGEPPPTPSLSAADAQRMAAEGQALLEELNADGRGVAATAVVMRFEPTGVEVNGDNPLAVITAKVLPPDGAAYDARIVGVFARAGLAKYEPGKEIHVRFDPRQRQRVVFDLAKTRSMKLE